MPGAKVLATERSTNEAFHAVTNQDGYYTLPYLQPSTYDLEVEATGFTSQRRTNVTLMVAEKLDLPIQLELGKVSETITVVAESASLQTADASIRNFHFPACSSPVSQPEFVRADGAPRDPLFLSTPENSEAPSATPT